MVLLLHKLALPLKFPSNHRSSGDPSASLRNFRSRISGFITQTWSKPEPGPEKYFLSQTGFDRCFELIQTTNRAFAKLVVEIDHPVSRWSGKLTESYLSHTLISLDILNAVSSSVSHLNQAKISISHAVSLIQKSSPPPSSAAAIRLNKIAGENPSCKKFKSEGLSSSSSSSSIRLQERPGFENEESVVLQALVLCKKIVLMALGSVLSGLCGDGKMYVEIKKLAGGFDDSLIKDLDFRFRQEIQGNTIVMEEVKEINNAIEEFSMEELKIRLNKLENLIESVEKQANHLFSEILAARNKLLDNLRL
ncbi:hypothetical protein ACP275_02G125100 [Erythranthe tilingii]